MKQWAKREEQTDRVLQATVGMYGDLQGLMGSSLPEIKQLVIEDNIDNGIDELAGTQEKLI